MVVKSIRTRIDEASKKTSSDPLPEIEFDLGIDDGLTDDDVYIGDDGQRYYSEQWVMQILESVQKHLEDSIEEYGDEWFSSTKITDEDLTRL